jgi:hypothetical protein
MEDLPGFYGYTRPKHACIVLQEYNIVQLMSQKKTERLTAI